MNIGIIGEGAIGQYVSEQLRQRGLGLAVSLVRAERLGQTDRQEIAKGRVASVAELPDDMDLMVDCAGHAALAAYGPDILARGIDLVTVSIGALADEGLYQRLEQAARDGKAQLQLASGALGALDCLQAAKVGELNEVVYTGRKPPQGWRGSPAETRIDLDALDGPAVHFEGTAREAALAYPKNANVAAAVALAGSGLDHTQVQLIADPDVTANIHEVSATGAFGRFSFRIEGATLPDNTRTSALAAMSVVAAIERHRAAITC